MGEWGTSNQEDRAALAGQLYRELRQLAGSMFASERADHTLQPTALVHEAILKLALGRSSMAKDPTHLMALAAHAMRQVLVDHARARLAVKRGGGAERIELIEAFTGDVQIGSPAIDIMALEEAILALERRDPRAAEVVTLRFFAGLTVAQAATVLGLSTFAVEEDWRFARAWLADRLSTRA